MDPIDRKRHAALFDAELLTLQVVRGYVTVRHRNAWHATTSRRYQGTASLNMTRRQAEDVAEGWRQRGSSFRIREVPTLVLGTTMGPVAIAEFHTMNSFARWKMSEAERVLTVGTRTGVAIESLGQFSRGEDVSRHPDWEDPNPAKHSFIIGRPVWDDLVSVERETEFDDWSSTAVGSPYRLAWSYGPYDRTQRAQATTGILDAFRDVNGGRRVADGEARYQQAGAEWGAKAHAFLTAGVPSGVDSADWAESVRFFSGRLRPLAIRHARTSTVTAAAFQPAVEWFLGDVFGIRGRRLRNCAPLRRGPDAFPLAVEHIDAVLQTISAQEEQWIRATYLLWGAPQRTPQLAPTQSSKILSKLRHPSRSTVLREDIESATEPAPGA